ncbi:MAG: DUF1223 domain-containing protein [Proteobacteria bacterium]|nr:DUF1223 domain-containing protein [Pseudomonadota bacterium]
MLRSSGFLALVLMGLFAMPASAQTRPVVVELFTSQGCSSCPPADANLIELMDRADVLALSFGVTYWNYLGWDDTFSKQEFTDRQFAYEGPLGHAGAFTPQMVIDGAHDAVGHDLAEVEALIAEAAAAAAGGPAIEATTDRIEIGAGAVPARAADVWLVAYAPDIAEIPVARGENRRRVLKIGHAVRSLTRLGQWSGPAQSFDLPPAEEGLARAVLVQAGAGGPILGASKL